MPIQILDNIIIWQHLQLPVFIDKLTSTHEYLINLAITAQNEIGWDKLLRGPFLPIWNPCYEQWEKRI